MRLLHTGFGHGMGGHNGICKAVMALSSSFFGHHKRSWLSSLAKTMEHGTLACLASGPGRAPSGWNHGNYMHGWLLIWAANRLVHQQLWPINGKPNLGNTWGETNWSYNYLYIYICTCIYIYIHIYAHIYICVSLCKFDGIYLNHKRSMWICVYL